ncbi:hypothetical protein ACOSP7_013506 [Xanthoceras sorbifolium]
MSHPLPQRRTVANLAPHLAHSHTFTSCEFSSLSEEGPPTNGNPIQFYLTPRGRTLQPMETPTVFSSLTEEGPQTNGNPRQIYLTLRGRTLQPMETPTVFSSLTEEGPPLRGNP